MSRSTKVYTRAFTIGILFVLGLSLSGCGRKKVMDLPEQTASSTDGEESTSDGLEHLSYTIDGERGKHIIVDADVNMDGYDNVSIYNVEFTEIDDAWLDQFAKNVFDGGNYEVIKPYRICSLEELMAEEEYVLNILGEEDWSMWGGLTGIDEAGAWTAERSVRYYIENHDESNVREFPEGTLIYTDEEGTDSRLRGMIDGEEWELRYVSHEDRTIGKTGFSVEYSGDDLYLSDTPTIEMYPMGRNTPSNGLYPMEGTIDDEYFSYKENLLDYGSACETAENLIADLGIGGMELAYAKQIIYISEEKEDETIFDGYYLIFTKENGRVQNAYGGNSLARWDGQIAVDGILQEYIGITIASSGVVRIRISNFYEEKESLADEVTLLSFEQVDKIAQIFMEDILARQRSIETFDIHELNEFNITSVKLTYVALLYDGEYSLVPIWVYVNDDTYDVPIIYFGINAVDGQLILFDYQ